MGPLTSVGLKTYAIQEAISRS